MAKKTAKSVARIYDPDLHDRLKLLVYSRLVFISILFAATYFIGLRDEELVLGISVVYLFVLIGSTMLASLAFVLSLFAIGRERQNRLRILSYAQIFWDILFASGVVYITGGVDSIFFILYYLNIFLASSLLFRKGGFLAASLSAICYGLILAFQVHDILPRFYDEGYELTTINETHVLAKIVINILFFFFLAWISSLFTERLRKTQVLLEERNIDVKNLEDFNRAIVESLKSGLLTMDNSNTVISHNQAARHILGLKASEIAGHSITDILPQIGEKILSDYVLEINKQKSPWRWETEHRRPDGKTVFIGLNLVPFRITSVIEGGKVVIFEDLTDYKEMEARVKRTEKLAAVGELAAGIAHEIRNPLASVSGAIEMLKQEASYKGGENRLMDIVTRETTRLNYLIGDFLNFAKTPKLSREVFNINALIEETVELFLKSRSEWNGTGIEKSFCENIYVSADPQQMKQVIWNLLKNASQAMSEPGKIFVRTLADHENNELIISVRDEGEGILPEDMSKIFSPFYTTKKGGTGLGLATIHKIIEEHGGKVTVSSTPGVGTEFKIFLQVH